MDYDRTFRNWRWWLILPIAGLVLPFALVDMFSVYVIRPRWTRICEWTHRVRTVSHKPPVRNPGPPSRSPRHHAPKHPKEKK